MATIDHILPVSPPPPAVTITLTDDEAVGLRAIFACITANQADQLGLTDLYSKRDEIHMGMDRWDILPSLSGND